MVELRAIDGCDFKLGELDLAVGRSTTVRGSSLDGPSSTLTPPSLY